MIDEEEAKEYPEVTGKRKTDQAEIDVPNDGYLVRPHTGMKICAAARSV
jgi:hypothetical protein